ncbi:hypothetical protein [Rhodococcus tukisamuensis]|uniref:Ig-like domain-containing protein n=1 Tax=Rhodococcus tukisamuensis TaxID=168276 RepID=A0A1G6SSF6_9NOCA|nr:hypothetical protein [Rhodococcus tukisamuensis]SDD19860.1 hypothetical protein SAMN05444580_103255 [Rhodococcus tukisamuensis]
MFTRKAFGRTAALIAAAGALSLAVPAAASAAPAPFLPSSISSCAPGEWLTFTADRVAPDRINYTTTAPQSKWNGAVVQWTNMTTGSQGFAFLNAPPASVGTGPVVSMVVGILPCAVSSGAVVS